MKQTHFPGSERPTPNGTSNAPTRDSREWQRASICSHWIEMPPQAGSPGEGLSELEGAWARGAASDEKMLRGSPRCQVA
ncbi:hypothetical protein JOQ06_016856, partial [Pogonophryne albipinna]